MHFNLANKPEADSARMRLAYLAARGKRIELKEVKEHRTLSQNAYLHLIISDFGQHFGYTDEEAKQIYKELSPNTYKYVKKGRTFWRSSAVLNKEEMAKTIDTFMKKSADAGYPLPPATNQEWLRQIENEIERSKYYVKTS